MFLPATPVRAVLADAPLARFETPGSRPAGGEAPLFVPDPETVTPKPTSLAISRRELKVLTGHEAVVSGHLLGSRRPRGLSGRRLLLQTRRGHGWSTIASTHTGPRGRFRVHYVPRHIGSELLRLRFSGDQGDRRATQMVGRLNVSRPAEARSTDLQAGIASWYEDGGETACGFHAGLGVANKTLPCGTKLRICYQGCETATVDDRGPFVEGRVLDLDASAKAAISCSDLCEVRYGAAG
jgi:hypothetical protein